MRSVQRILKFKNMKVIPNIAIKELLIRNIKNLKVLYKHSENSFIVSGTQLNEKNENISFNIDRNTFITNVLTNITSKESPSPKSSKKIVIDFSSPNVAKPFHVGHLRSTIIGNYIANINKYFNNKVTKINYLGDWGTQFGLLQYGLNKQKIDLNKLQENPLKTLYNTYVYANKLAKIDDTVHKEARKYFSEIESGQSNLENWRKIRETTVKELGNVYQRLGIAFDEYHWESDYNGGAIHNLMSTLENKGIITTDGEGRKVTKVKDKDVTVIKSDNSTLYLARDIAALLDRYKKFQFDKMLYVVDNAQTDHFSTLFDVVSKIDGKCSERCEHVKFGRIKGMSTRAGNVVFLNDILDEAKQKMFEKQGQSKNTRSSAVNEDTCDILGTTAVIINDLKQNRLKDYTFDWNKALQSEGDSGIKLQYLHCRLWSLEQNCGVTLPEECDPKYLTDEVIGLLVAEISKFNSVLERSLEEYEACILVNYLFRLARYVNRMFNELKVKNVDSDLARQRLLVFHSARLVVKTGLEILGVKPLNKM